jgi:hypothetical protein
MRTVQRIGSLGARRGAMILRHVNPARRLTAAPVGLPGAAPPAARCSAADSDRRGCAGSLSAGSHTFLARAVDTTGQFRDSTSTFNVVRFPSSFIGNPDNVNLLGASPTIVDANTLRLDNVMVQGVSYNLTLRWNTATQGFALVGK